MLKNKLYLTLVLIAGLLTVGCTKVSQTPNQTQQLTPEPQTSESTEPIDPIPTQDTNDYVPGEILVTFNEGTTYAQGKQLFQTIGVTEYKNGYWVSTNKTATDDTLLTIRDLFTLQVTQGNEDQLIETLNNQAIVRGAFKNFIGKIDN